MKLLSLVFAAASAVPAFSQMVSIAAPAPGTALTPGSSVVVELDSAVRGLINVVKPYSQCF